MSEPKTPLFMYTSPLLRHFAYSHLPPFLQDISKPFHDLAHSLGNNPIYDCIELEAALRKLLEAKDCAVRACLEPR